MKEETFAFCPNCGRLEINNGEIIHPRLDEIIVDMYDKSFISVYTKV